MGAILGVANLSSEKANIISRHRYLLPVFDVVPVDEFAYDAICI